MTGFAHQDLTIEVDEDGAAMLRLDWRGKSNARDPQKVLRPFLDSVVGRAVERSLSLELHFEGIEHLNSSTVTALIQLIQRTRKAKLPLVLVFDPSLQWQRVSFDALRIFEGPDGLFTVQEAG